MYLESFQYIHTVLLVIALNVYIKHRRPSKASFLSEPSLTPGRDLFFLPSEITLMFESGFKTHR